MPPHCDSLDGPVVRAARTALEVGDVALALPYVRADGEAEVRRTFDRDLAVRELGPDAREVADRLFFETVVRIHRAGEGAPYTGLKPAGLSVGPVIPLAERAVDTGSPDEVGSFLAAVLGDELKGRLEHVGVLAGARKRSVDDARRYVEASLAFQVYAHRVYEQMRATAHGHQPERDHERVAGTSAR
jgi:hypothetical protein